MGELNCESFKKFVTMGNALSWSNVTDGNFRNPDITPKTGSTPTFDPHDGFDFQKNPRKRNLTTLKWRHSVFHPNFETTVHTFGFHSQNVGTRTGHGLTDVHTKVMQL